MQKTILSMPLSTWPLEKTMVPIGALKCAISGKKVVSTSVLLLLMLGPGGEDGGEREEMRRGGLQMGAMCDARSVPDAELPTMRTFC